MKYFFLQRLQHIHERAIAGAFMEKFEGLDFYDIESLLTEEEIMIRDMVRDYVDEEVIPHIEKACEDGVFLDKWRQDLGEMGVLGAPLKGYGCPGLSYVAYGLICQELERGCLLYTSPSPRD